MTKPQTCHHCFGKYPDRDNESWTFSAPNVPDEILGTPLDHDDWCSYFCSARCLRDYLTAYIERLEVSSEQSKQTE